jgi:hypothetical protein
MPPTLTVVAVSGPAGIVVLVGRGAVVLGAVVLGAVVVVLCAPAAAPTRVPPRVANAEARTTPATLHPTGAPRRGPVTSGP